jgi:hypothetical protein
MVLQYRRTALNSSLANIIYILLVRLYSQHLSLANPLVDPLQINNEVPLFRVQSQGSGTRIPAFGNAVRLRDNRCIVTQEEVPYTPDPNWSGFEAAHIFPLAHQTHWVNQNYGRWITVPSTTGGSINSVQNGLLLRADIHQHFDGYFFSINPDVCIYNLCKDTAANPFRIITRLWILGVFLRVMLEGILTKHFSIIRKGHQTSFCGGTSDKPCLLI